MNRELSVVSCWFLYFELCTLCFVFLAILNGFVEGREVQSTKYKAQSNDH